MPLVASVCCQAIRRDEERGDGTLRGRRLRFVMRLEPFFGQRRESQTSLPEGIGANDEIPNDELATFVNFLLFSRLARCLANAI